MLCWMSGTSWALSVRVTARGELQMRAALRPTAPVPDPSSSTLVAGGERTFLIGSRGSACASTKAPSHVVDPAGREEWRDLLYEHGTRFLEFTSKHRKRRLT